MSSGSLAFQHRPDLEADLTKFGFLVYAGDVRNFHEWEFRAMTRWNQTKDDEKKDLASKFLDSLSGEAYIAAEDLGTEILFSKENIPKVIEAVRKNLFPLVEQESKELYRLGTQIGGILSRQAGESMTSYLSRRNRWWRKLKQLDDKVQISEGILTDLLLDNAGINRQERLMVLTALGGSTKTEDAEKALIKMHSRIHLLEKKNAQPSKGKGQSGKAFYGKGRKGKTFKGASYSYLSTTEELFEDPYADGSNDGAAYPALDGEDDWSYPGYPEEDGEGDDPSGDGAELVACTADAPLKDVELDVFTAFMTTEGWDPDNRESVALLTEAVQCETMAYMARSKAKGKGKPVKGAHSYRPRPSTLSVEDRRRKLQEIKAKSTCKVCGRRGHWAGDKECSGKPSTSGGGTAYVALGVSTRDCATQTDASLLRRTSSVTSSDDGAADHGYYARLTPVAYMGFFDGEDFAASDEELLDESPGGETSQGSPWDVLDYPEGGDTQFNFGMHRGSTYLEVLRQHPDYYHWGLQEKKPSPQLTAYLTWVYRHFVMPPAGAGTATLRERPLSVEEIDLDRARSEAVLSKKPKSKLSMLRQQDEPCAGGCPAHAISRAGSNSYVVKTTCMLCGHRTSEPRPKATPKKVYGECEHARADYRGSTRSVHKVYCLDCCTYIEEVPQRLHKAGKELAGKVQDLPLGQQDLTRRQLDEVEFTSMEAGSIIKQFVKYWDKRLCRVQPVTSTELSSVLMDMIDDHRPQSGSASASASAAAGVGRSVSAPRTPPRPQASAAGAGSSPAPRTPPRAMAASATPKRSPERRGYMAVAEKGDAAGHTVQEAHVTLSEGTGQDSFVEPSLPLVDPLEDNTSIYVMLDEGCNTTCHGKGWRLHAERILANHGMQLLQVSQTSGTFKGVGASKTTGKWRVPFALQMEPTGALLHGDLESAELDSNDVPCLLSLTEQVQLGFVKNLRSGTVTLEDFPGQQLPLARHARTGLLLMRMRISCFGNVPHRLHAPFCKGELRSPLASRPGVVVKDPQLAYMVDDTEVTTSQPAVPRCKKVRFFTFGLERLEQAPGSTRNSYGLTNLFKTFRQKGKSFEFNLADPKHEDILLDCLRANFPQLLENIPDKRIIFLDCRATGDPAIDKSTRDHVGWFPFNLENMVRQEQWTKWWKEIHETFHRAIHEEEEIYVFTFCKSGRHRSLANQRLLQFVVEDYGVPRWDLNHLNQFGRHNCGGGCADCRWEAPGAREKAMVCVDLARKLWREYTKELQASKAGEASAPSSAGAASDPSGGTSTAPGAPSAPVQAEPRPAAEPTRPAGPATGPEAEAAGPTEPAGTACTAGGRGNVQSTDQGRACSQARVQADAAALRKADPKGQG